VNRSPRVPNADQTDLIRLQKPPHGSAVAKRRCAALLPLTTEDTVLEEQIVAAAAAASHVTHIVVTLPSGATVSFAANTPPDELRRHIDALGLDNPLSPYLSTKQAARYLQISERNVHRLIEQNQLPVDRIGRRLVFHRDKLDEWVATRGGEVAA
jgi:excisionase family DNA binding protein